MTSKINKVRVNDATIKLNNITEKDKSFCMEFIGKVRKSTEVNAILLNINHIYGNSVALDCKKSNSNHAFFHYITSTSSWGPTTCCSFVAGKCFRRLMAGMPVCMVAMSCLQTYHEKWEIINIPFFIFLTSFLHYCSTFVTLHNVLVQVRALSRKMSKSFYFVNKMAFFSASPPNF